MSKCPVCKRKVDYRILYGMCAKCYARALDNMRINGGK